MVFLRGLPHPGIVRLVEMTPKQERADGMLALASVRHATVRGPRAEVSEFTRYRGALTRAGSLLPGPRRIAAPLER